MKALKQKTSKGKRKSNSPNQTHCHPIHGEPAFFIEFPKGLKGNMLVIADLHYGIEHSIELAGARLPSQTDRITDRIVSLCTKHKASKLILLGDIKHTVPLTSKQEWRELPKVFSRLLETVESIDIFPGNHDGNLQRLIPQKLAAVTVHPANGAVLHDIGFFHGHTWPSSEILKVKLVLMAHNHPNVLFIDKLGGRASYSCWVRGHLALDLARERYPEIKKNDPEIIIMPAFNDIGSGTPVNSSKPEFLGPLLRNQYLDLDSASVYLLDGTALGTLRELINLSSISK